MATIRINDLRTESIIGIHKHERKKKQPLIINITCTYNSTKSERTDTITDAVDYDTLTKKILAHVSASHYFLIERLASSILEIVMENKKIKEATVHLHKPQAIKEARSVSIELHAQRSR